MNTPHTVTLVFDGGCTFCRRSLAWLKRFDRNDRLRYLDSNDPGVREALSRLKDADFDRAMWADDGSAAFRGFYAFRRAAKELPWLRPLALLAYVPGVPQIGERAYQLIADHRSRLGCDSTACKI